MGVATFLACGVALAATFVGDEGPNTIVGTAESDSIDGRGGDDALHGGGSADAVYGGFVHDLIRGGPGNDNPGFDIVPGVKGLYGGFGDDRIGDPAPGALDRILCGAGIDFVEASPGDFVASDCERMNRS